MIAPDSPFFLGIDGKKPQCAPVWDDFTTDGKILRKILSVAKKEFNLQGKVANHSVRKTGISLLLDNNVPEIYVAQHSGMESVDSLKSYKSANAEQQLKMCDAINDVSTASYTIGKAQVNLLLNIHNQRTHDYLVCLLAHLSAIAPLILVTLISFEKLIQPR